MNNITDLSDRFGRPSKGLAGDPPPPQNDGMESRVAKIEAIIPTLATKADVEAVRGDLHKMDASITRWMIATVISLFLGFAGLFFTMSNTINGALERAAKPAPVAQPAPIVIQVPSNAPAAAQEHNK